MSDERDIVSLMDRNVSGRTGNGLWEMKCGIINLLFTFGSYLKEGLDW